MTPITRNSIGIDGDVFEERRKESRRRVFRGATLSFNRGYGALECVVRNQSEHGARLAFGDASAVPSRFELTVNGETRRRQANVRWRSSRDVGVVFEDR